ncbi:hypothetical protein DM035_16000 [Salmonella enterica subsp. enterica serovar Kottbus]|uniref:Uncharacterized protein n=1 Tax=Salmonella enterica subsp. enterica serovar Kottbus TaxID=224727 RepID=A0A5U6MBF6_SALET|nr:hypothetical protein [Salmonella enterica subsp. enterica serovar Kottbus]
MLRRNSHVQTKLGDMPSLNNCVRLTYGHRTPLNHFNYRETRELASNKHRLGSVVPTNNVESGEDNQPSLRGEVQRLCGSLRPAQNLRITFSYLQNTLVILDIVNYESFVVLNLHRRIQGHFMH